MKKLIKLILFAIIALWLIVLGINFYINFQTKKFIYKKINEPPQAQVALVLGARVKADGQMSDMFRDRVLTAIDLYRSQKVQKIFISGDHGQKYYDEVNTAKKFLLAEGIPAEVIYLDHAGFDTFDSVYRAKHIFAVESAIIVSQEFHLPRALFLAKRVGLNATGISADRQLYYSTAYSRHREMLAKVKALYDIVFNSKPLVLGPSIPISGPSQATWD